MPQRFTAEEAQRVFARAAARQHTHASPPDGLTLPELQAIGREAGLDPAHVAAVVAEGNAETETQTTWHGVPVGITRTRLLPDRVSDAEWERIVDVLRSHYNQPGTAQQIGRRREWTTAAGSAAHRVTVEPRDDGDLVRIQTPDTARPFAIGVGGSSIAAALIVFLSVVLVTGDWAGPALFSGAILAFGVAMYGAAFLSARIRAPRRIARHDALLDRIDLLSRGDAPPVASPTDALGLDAASHLDLDGLEAAPGAGRGATQRRDRA